MYDFSKVDERNLLPEGDYEAAIVKAVVEEFGPSVQFEILGPKYSGYKLFDRYKVRADDNEYREKQNKKFKRLLKALTPYKDQFTSDQSLVDHLLSEQKLIIKVKTFVKDNGGEANFVGGYALLEAQSSDTSTTIKNIREQMGPDGLTPKVDSTMTSDDIPF